MEVGYLMDANFEVAKGGCSAKWLPVLEAVVHTNRNTPLPDKLKTVLLLHS